MRMKARIATGAVGLLTLLGTGAGLAHAAQVSGPVAGTSATDTATPGDTADVAGAAEAPEATGAAEAPEKAGAADIGPNVDVQQTGDHQDPGDAPGSK